MSFALLPKLVLFSASDCLFIYHAGKSTVVQLISDIYNNNNAIVGNLSNDGVSGFPLEHLLGRKVSSAGFLLHAVVINTPTRC